MASSISSSITYTLQKALLLITSLLGVVAADVGGGQDNNLHYCPPFSCGHLHNISYPFRLQGDTRDCGIGPRPWYDLSCNNGKATIQINTRTYYVSSIDYTDQSFLAIDATLQDDSNSSNCPLPGADLHPPNIDWPRPRWEISNDSFVDLDTDSGSIWACFVNCSKPIIADANMPRYFRDHISGASIRNITRAIFWSDIHFASCRATDHVYTTKLMSFVVIIVSVIAIIKLHFGMLELPSLNHYSCNVLFELLLVPLVVFIFLAHKYWKTRITIDAVEKFLRMQQMIGPTRYAYTDIIAITSHFRDKLGQGGYGSVYKGVLLPGNVHIAVKMLTGSSSCNGDEFISEVSTIGRIHHVNVVRLIGFCSEEMRRALVYEYMPRGSLDKYIFSVEKSFSWDKLNEIALGIARGINYLHQGCEMQILHFDIKPHNILLDDNFVPKVADFGLAKLYPRDKSFVPVSAARGTIGYIAPEMISRSFGTISSKSDVYSFGMLLLEMAGGRRNADPNAANSSQAYYPSRVYKQLTRRETCEISDIVDMHELEKKLCVVGLWCIQMRSSDRPTMSEVIEMLEGGSDDLQVPPKPFFCDDEQPLGVEPYHLSSDLTAISEAEEDDDDESISLFQSFSYQ
uniref:Protein kinase domain-containing protein n=1 Tax=Oryza glaberrima TaxID=4538 RepID=I1NJR1_ORYGL